MISKLKLERLNRNCPQWQLAQVVGMSPSRLSMIETGRIRPRDEEVARLAAALGVGAVDLFPALSGLDSTVAA